MKPGKRLGDWPGVLVVVITADDGTVTVEGPLLDGEAAHTHADKWLAHGLHAQVVPLTRLTDPRNIEDEGIGHP